MTFQRILPSKTMKENQTILSLPSSVSVHSSPVHSSVLLNSPQQQQQHCFWCLDEKEKFFNISDCHLNNGKHSEIISETNKKLFVSEIKNVFNGQQLISHLNQQQHGAGKLYKKSQNILRCGNFIELNNSEFLLCAQNEQEFSDWYEAINCLCWPQKSFTKY
uniref:PH domain-containing protein n=2 Tax=Meloidogyne hapla TaxID=6305 RepID=A0A1I8BVJ1_MELHA